jgi:hypothetical protein
MTDEETQEDPGERMRLPVAIEETIAVASLALLLVITLANVLVRYFSDESFAWTEEISVFLMVVLTLAGAAAAARATGTSASSSSMARVARAPSPPGAADLGLHRGPVHCAGGSHRPGRLGRIPLWRDLDGDRHPALVVHGLAAGVVRLGCDARRRLGLRRARQR